MIVAVMLVMLMRMFVLCLICVNDLQRFLAQHHVVIFNALEDEDETQPKESSWE